MPRKNVKEQETKAVAVKSESLVSEEKPSYLQELEKKGLRNSDNFDSSDVVVPRIKLLQATSDEISSFDAAKPGLFWFSGLDQPLGESLDFVICTRKKKYLLVAPMEDGQGVLARADDAKTWDSLGQWEVKVKGQRKPVTWAIKSKDVQESGLLQWGTSNPEDPDSPPAATLFYEYLVLMPDHLNFGPAVITLTRSQIKRAKKGLNDKIKLHETNGRPIQSIVFRANSIDDRNPDGQLYKNWNFTGNGFASEALYRQAVELSNMLTDYRVNDESVSDGTDEADKAEENKEY